MIKLNIQLADKEINSPMTVRARPSGERFSFLDSITKTYRMDRTPTAKTAAVPPVTSLITAEPQNIVISHVINPLISKTIVEFLIISSLTAHSLLNSIKLGFSRSQ